MKEIRCLYCGKLLLLASGNYTIEIKCNRCKKINNITEKGEKNGR